VKKAESSKNHEDSKGKDDEFEDIKTSTMKKGGHRGL